MIFIYIQSYKGANEGIQKYFNVFQMATWMQNRGKLYLPPAKPSPRVLSTDEYVEGTQLYFYAGSERLLTVGHPYFDVYNNGDESLTVPKVSANQYRVMKLDLPDPNKFALVNKSLYNPERERLVWKLTGLQIGRGGPIGISSSGHPLFNKYGDTENPNMYPAKQEDADDNRMDVSMDPKQTQLFIVGCKPPIGEHWDVGKICENAQPEKGSCPPIQLVHSTIQDGDMCDIGFGAANFKTLQEDKSGVPMDILNETCKYPDFLLMSKDKYGDSLFFYGRKEQLYARHFFMRGGLDGDSFPLTNYIYGAQQGKPQNTIGPYNYFVTPSGSLYSTDSQLFNRPYWLSKAQGANNGILWNNHMFITVMDNTRGTNINISVYKQNEAMAQDYKYKANDFRNYLRHCEEYEVELIVELCKVRLDPDVLAHINVMNPSILENWELSFIPPAPQGIEDTYRYLQSLATSCPSELVPPERPDPYEGLVFWNINLEDKLSEELSQFPLGKRFLYQSGYSTSRKRKLEPGSSGVTVKKIRTVKRKKSKL